MGETGRERVLKTLRHRQPDRIPFDLASTLVTGITKGAYARLLSEMGAGERDIKLCDIIQQLAVVDEDILQQLEVDVRGLIPNFARKSPNLEENERGLAFTDEWGVRWERSRGSLYFNIAQSPLAGDIKEKDIDTFSWPDPAADVLFAGLREQAKQHYENGYAIILENLCAGVFEMSCRIRGAEQFYMDLAINHSLACALMDKIVDLKVAYYRRAAETLGRYVQLIREVDDIAGQQAMLVSPDMYRQLIKPRHKKLFEAQKCLFLAPFFVFFHSDGAIYDILPDFIEIGVEVLNPVQITAKGMDAEKLKRRFGKDLVFWGGGVNTQQILPCGTPQQVKTDVKDRIRIFSPGGGFVFGAVHNIQDDVPAENIIAMLEAFREVRDY
jgi:uroporphyrinogen decarboxylase